MSAADCFYEPMPPMPPNLALPTHATYQTTALALGACFGVLNFFAHLSFLIQCRGLIGERGIAPATEKQTAGVAPIRQAAGTIPASPKSIARFSPSWFTPAASLTGIFRYVRASSRNLELVLLIGTLFGFAQFAGGISSLFVPPNTDVHEACLERTALESLIASLTWFLPPCWLCSFVCLACYYSVREVSDRFMGLQMHATVLELNFWFGFFALFGDARSTVVAFQFYTMRLMVGGGLGKVTSGDDCWNARGGFSAMSFHYWTQPLPNPLSRWFHFMPEKIHVFQVLATLLVECPLMFICAVLPARVESYLFFMPPLRLIAFLAHASMLLMINISGNFGFLILASVAASVALLDDKQLSFVVPNRVFHCVHAQLSMQPAYNSTMHDVFNLAATDAPAALHLSLRIFLDRVLPWFSCVAYCMIQLVPLAGTYRPPLPPPFETIGKACHSIADRVWRVIGRRARHVVRGMWRELQQCYEACSRHGLVNRYVKFATMTKFRYEIVIQAKPADVGSKWIDIPMKFKPWNVDVAPKVVWPPFHLPSLDWFLWFIPLQVSRGNTSPPHWLVTLLERIKDQEPSVLALLDTNELRKLPFSQQNKPACVRAVLYDFVFTPPSYAANFPDVVAAASSPASGTMQTRLLNQRDLKRSVTAGGGIRTGPVEIGKWWTRARIGTNSLWEV